MNIDPAQFLAACDIVDWEHPQIAATAAELGQGRNELETAEACFQFVRDNIEHSWDYRRNPITCRASEALVHGTGYCFAKSHLLCALLRANGIPAGLCYQRLSVAGDGPPFSLHGLNAVHLKEFGWYRLDARGNREDVQAAFCPPVEQLAFRVRLPQERDYADIHPSPLPEIVAALRSYTTWQEFAENLPDRVDQT